MPTLDIDFPDATFFILQEKLYKWIQIKQIVNWTQIHKVCLQLLSEFDNSYTELYGNYPEYKIFMPLLRNGFCEVAMNNGKQHFVPLCREYTENENYADPYLLLNNFPTLYNLISTFEKEDTLELKYKCNLFDKYKFEPIESFSYETGIYKTHDEVYYSSYVFDGEDIRRIPSYSENIDSINIARCFVRSQRNDFIFFLYDDKQKELYCMNYSELPIIVTRALVFFAKPQLADKIYKYPLDRNTPYKNIQSEVIKELQRIFGRNAVGEYHG